MAAARDTLRIGSGAGFSADRLDPAVRLIENAQLDWIGFECLAERTLALAQVERAGDPSRGYDRFLQARLEACLPLLAAHGTRMITNMGAANPRAGAELAASMGARVAYIEGDDVRHLLGPETILADTGKSIADTGRALVSANAYLGVEQILPAIDTGADLIITGRVADPSLFLAPLVHAFGWALDDWERLGAGTLVGHLLECAGQVTGGYFPDPGYKDAPGLDARALADLGFPFADVDAQANCVIGKLLKDGGVVDARTVKEQILYEVHDPSAYLTPDVTADFSRVTVEELSRDRVRVAGASGRRRPDTLKVTVALDGGLIAESGISYAGPGATARAQLAADILRERLKGVEPLRIDLVGVSSLHASHEVTRRRNAARESDDVRVRVAARSDDPKTARRVLWEVEALYTNGPSGGGGVRGDIRRGFVTHDVYLPRDEIRLETKVLGP